MQNVLPKDKTVTIDDKVGNQVNESRECKKKSLDLDKYYDSRNKTAFLSSLNKDNQKKLIAFSSYALTSLELTIKEESEEVHALAPSQYEIWSLDFGLNVGSEMNKIRPCIIVSYSEFNANSNLVTIIPITTTISEFIRDTQFIINQDCVNDEETKVYGIAKAEGITTKSKARLGEKIGILNERGIECLEKALCAHLFKNKIILRNSISKDEVIVDSVIDKKQKITNQQNKYSNFKSTQKNKKNKKNK